MDCKLRMVAKKRSYLEKREYLKRRLQFLRIRVSMQLERQEIDTIKQKGSVNFGQYNPFI